MKKIYIILSIICCVLFVACELTDFDLQDDPNRISINSTTPDLMINAVQLKFGGVVEEYNVRTMATTRYWSLWLQNYFSTGGSAWDDTYALREHAKAINKMAENDPNLAFYRGMAEIMTAYAMVTAVDYWGNIPYTEANNTDLTIRPNLDDGEFIYNDILDKLDLAIEDMNNATVKPQSDLFFDGDETKWIKVANSLKLKMLVNIGENGKDRLNALLAEDNFIESASDDFQFNYGVEDRTPRSNHPRWRTHYATFGSFIFYTGNYFITLLKDSKANPDPRIRYYLYRGGAEDPSPSIFPSIFECANDPMFNTCYPGDFYIGKDHGDTRRVPARDRPYLTVFGLYPIGGVFDEDNPVAPQYPRNVDIANHLKGAGITPILLSSFVEFFKAEAVVSIGANGDAAAFLEAGIRKSMDKVLNFKGVAIGSPFAATDSDVDDYVNEVLSNFAVASTSEEKLEIIITEYYLASFGNTIEAYNAYRRTGYPDLPPHVENPNIVFPRSFIYPDGLVTNSPNIEQKLRTDQVFWDTNPPGFID